MVGENDTTKYATPMEFNQQNSSENSSSRMLLNPFETQKTNFLNTKRDRNKIAALKLKAELHNNCLAASCDKSLKPNKYSNFIIFKMDSDNENSLQILQTSAAKQKANLNVSFGMIANQM